MRNHLRPFLLISMLLILALFMVGCEKERPAPTATRTPTAGTPTAGSRAPQARLTVVAPNKANSSGAQAAGQAAAPTDSTIATPQPQGAATTDNQAASTGDSFEYQVVAGDTLAKIASKFNVTQAAIISLNDISNPDIVVVGKVLKIPGQAPSGAAGPSADGGSTYTVKAGETLFSIASRFGISVKALQQANNITDADQVRSGQVLTIPGAAGAAQPGGAGKTYTVQRGDTLYSIAVRNGVTTAALQAANNLSNPNQIYVGQVLTIP